MIALLLDEHGAVAIPIAFAVTASIETVALGAVLLTKLRRREGAALAEGVIVGRA